VTTEKPHVEFLGAARTVTGSMHLVHAPHAKVLLECGLFQGRRRESFEKNSNLPFRARDIDAVVLSHAHIDHSGALPSMVKHGFRGPIFATPATRDLCAVMLEDAALIQAADARHITRMIERDHENVDPVEPLYDPEDVVEALKLFRTVDYGTRIDVAKGVGVTFLDAGHVLGSAIVVLDVEDGGKTKRIAFTGDLGRRAMPILRDPEVPSGADLLISESTYGDRLHAPIEEMDEALLDIVKKTVDRKGKVIVPSFALERAQEIVYSLKRMRDEGRLPEVEVYVDSPLTVRITDVFRMHPECYDEEAREMIGRSSPFDFPGVTYVESVEDSKAIDHSDEPCIIISASGMCEFGRVVHHLKAMIGKKENAVVIVGWQAPHTLGRRLVEGRSRVRVFGVERERRCEVHVLNGFSAHADQSDLLAYAESVRERGHLSSIALVHGEPAAQETLKTELEGRGLREVAIPFTRDRVEV
jgi:metallo-beta-lactamase family protein